MVGVEIAARGGRRAARRAPSRRRSAPAPSAAAATAPAARRPRRRARPRRRRSRALEVAAAGGHNLFLHGPPGTGKTMLARRLPVDPAAADARRGDRGHAHPLGRRPARRRRPGRPSGRSARRTTRSRPPGLVGGGAVAAPGEATLAHHGVLFLDELSEFAAPALEALRQPLEDGRVVDRPRPAGRAVPDALHARRRDEPVPVRLRRRPRAAAARDADLARHRRRLSGPLLDRIDLARRVQRPPADALAAPARTRSAAVRERVDRRARAPGARGSPAPASPATRR